MILGIVGSREFTNPRGLAWAWAIIAWEVQLTRWDSFATGDPTASNSHGADAMTVDACRGYWRECKIFTATSRRWKGPGGFEERNKELAIYCDELLCIRDPKSLTYGSGWTYDYMKNVLGKPAHLVEIS